ncbi:DNA topoisomerase I [Methanocaldococcus sp.]
MSVLIICEKPSVAKKIANALGKPKKKTIYNVPYYELERNGKKIIVASAVGHLFTLVEKNNTKFGHYPVFDVKWEPASVEKGKKYVDNYIKALKKLSKEADEIYIATDWDIEGELIGFHALKYCCSKTKAKRMRFSSLTKNEIVKAFENPDEIDYGLVDAGESRHIIDWYYGINLSRALMNAIKAVNRWKTMSVGRVQGPALSFLTERELEIKKFVPKPYWVIEALLKDNLKAIHEKEKFWDEKEAKNVYEKVKNEKFGKVVEIKRTVRKIKPLPPFDLGTLQREAYNYFKFSPKETQEIAQSLYEKGLCLHPDTLILLPDGVKKIKDLDEEGNILCLNKDLKLTKSKYKLLKRTVKEKLIKIILNDGTELIATKEHPILVYMDKLIFVPSGNLKKNEQVVTLSYGEIYIQKIKKIEEIDYEGEVYDLTVEKYHNFIANGVVVHNCSYPRTSSQKLPKDKNYLKNILNTLKNHPIYGKWVKDILNKRDLKPVEGKKEDPAHPAIHVVDIPKDKELSEKEKKIYDLIARRTLNAFWDNAEREYSNIKININGEIFKLSGSRTLKEGWHEIYYFPKFDDCELPKLNKGDLIPIQKITITKKETQPPKRYTVASIIKELEKRKLGTKATRAEIVEKLIKRGYVIDDGSLKVTDLGISVVETLKKFCPEIIDEKMTRDLEEKLEKIQFRKIKKDDVLDEAEQKLRKILEEFKKKEKDVGMFLIKKLDSNNTNSNTKENKENKTESKKVVGKCPKCGGDLILKKGRYGEFYGCSNYPKCKYTESINKEVIKKCPKCGGELIIREGKYGKFLGCSNYPKCKYTEKLNKKVNKT